MLRQVGIGAAAVLTAGLLAVGCSEDGDTIVQGGGGTDLNNSDQVNATSVASNNLAADGGGMSPDGHDADLDIKAVFATDHSTSDGTNGADSSAMVLFQVTDKGADDTAGGGDDTYRLFGTHFNGSSFTPPVELKFKDRDERVKSNIKAAAMVYVATAGYTAGTTANSDQVNAARANDGNWLILLDYKTFFDSPLNTVNQNPATNTPGPHRTAGLVVFLKSLRDQAFATSGLVGGTAASPGTSQNFFYGFQEYGTEIAEARSGEIAGTGLTGLGTTPQPNKIVPACDVTSFGFVTDGYAGQARFGGTALPLKGAGNVDANSKEVAYTSAEPNTGNATFSESEFKVGEVTNFVGLVYTQVVSSVATKGAGSSESTHGALYGADLKAFFIPFNLHTNTMGTLVELNPATTQARNPATGVNSCGTAFYPTFHVYNQYVFVKYADASLSNGITGNDQHSLQPGGASDEDWAQANTGGHDNKDIVPASGKPTFYEDIIARFRVVSNGDGTCQIASGQQLNDLTFFGTSESHDLTPPTINVGTTSDTYPTNREMMNFGDDGQSIFGADEGLLDTVMFYTCAFNSGSGVAATDGVNIDRTLCAIGINDQDGTKLTGTNPRRLSGHVKDFHSAAQRNAALNPTGTQGSALSGGELRDGVTGFEAAINRTGQYVVVGYLQNVGVSTAFHKALNAIAYQTQRPTTQAGVASTVAFDIRFSGVQQVSQNLGALTLRTFADGADGAETNERHNSLPVNSAMWQEGLEYRCGLQGNANVVNALWEQSDDTEDRAFVGQLTVALDVGVTGTPTLTVNDREELQPNANVQGYANYRDPLSTATNTAGRISAFRFIDGDMSPIDEKVKAVDLGLDGTDGDTTITGTDGGVAILYTMCTDNTTNDPSGTRDQADAAVIFQAYNGNTLETITVSEAFTENATPVGKEGVAGDFGNKCNGPMNYGTAAGSLRRGVAGLIAVGSGKTSVDASTAQAASSPATAHYLLFYGLRTDNASSSRALYTRKHQVRVTSGFTTSTVGERLIPVASTTAAAHKEPARLDHLQGNHVRSKSGTVTKAVDELEWIQRGAYAGVFFYQDRHVWEQTTSDGVTWDQTVAGAPNPRLVDNDTTADAEGFTVFFRDGGDCTEPNALLFFTKKDVDGDVRGRVRVGSF